MSRVDQLTASLRAARRRWRHPLIVRTEHTRGLQRRAGGHCTNRPGDRLHRALAGAPGDIRPGDAEQLEVVLATIKENRGDVPAIARQLDVGERTFRRWMGTYRVIGSAARIAVLEALLATEKAAS